MSALKKAESPPPMTVDEFIDWPGDGIHKRHQLVDGVVRAMAPASVTHGAIQANLAAMLSNHLSVKKSPCTVCVAPGISTRIRADVNMRIPDLGVTCAETEAGQIGLPEPVLLIEIMSPSNKSDTWDNVWAFASIPSVTEILVLQSTRIEAQLLRRDKDGAWPETPEQIDKGGRLTLASIGFKCALKDAYVKTHLVK